MQNTPYQQEDVDWVKANFNQKYLDLIHQKEEGRTQGIAPIAPEIPRETPLHWMLMPQK